MCPLTHILDKDYLRKHLEPYLVVRGAKKCWCFRNSKGKFERYPYRRVNGEIYKASTLMLWIHGIIPEPKPSEHRCKGGLVPGEILNLHECDNGEIGCVRPDHIFNGTQNINMQDCARKGRNPRLVPLYKTWAETASITREQILDAFNKCNGSKYKAAALLRLNAAHFYRKWYHFGFSRRLGRVTHCKHGHLYDRKNTYTSRNGARHCRICAQNRIRKSREGRKKVKQ